MRAAFAPSGVAMAPTSAKTSRRCSSSQHDGASATSVQLSLVTPCTRQSVIVTENIALCLNANSSKMASSAHWLNSPIQNRAMSQWKWTRICSLQMGIKLCASDLARQRFSEDGSKPTLAQRLAIGGCAGATAQVHPLHDFEIQAELSSQETPSQETQPVTSRFSPRNPRSCPKIVKTYLHVTTHRSVVACRRQLCILWRSSRHA